MINKILFILLFSIPLQLPAQDCYNQYGGTGDCAGCKSFDYNPVCGCDGNNYRTECEAFNCASLLRDSSTICDYVDFDIRPTVVSNFPSLQVGTAINICVYMKYNGSAIIQIYNTYGRIMYEAAFFALNDDVFLPGNIQRGITPQYLELPGISSYERGVYIIVVSGNGQVKSKKILKI